MVGFETLLRGLQSGASSTLFKRCLLIVEPFTHHRFVDFLLFAENLHSLLRACTMIPAASSVSSDSSFQDCRPDTKTNGLVSLQATHNDVATLLVAQAVGSGPCCSTGV